MVASWPLERHKDARHRGGSRKDVIHFAPLAKSYLGLDYVPRMIELSRANIGERDHVKFRVADARDLSFLHDELFNLIVFSFNGIDYVGHEDRLKILHQIRSHLTSTGLFYFSTHSLLALPLKLRIPKFDVRSPVKYLYQLAQSVPGAVRTICANRNFDLQAARERGWAILRDSAHRFSLRTYYTMPHYQARQLDESGFKLRAIYNLNGDLTSLEDPALDPSLCYLCEKK